MTCHPLSNITWKADTPLDITVRYHKHHGYIKMRSNSTVAELREKIMRLTYITPDYQWLTLGDEDTPLRGNDHDDQRILADLFGKKKVVELSKSYPVTSIKTIEQWHLERGICVDSRGDERHVVTWKDFTNVSNRNTSIHEIQKVIFKKITDSIELSQNMQNISPESICLVRNDKPLESLEMLHNGDTIEATLLFGRFPATPILPSHVLSLTVRKNHSSDAKNVDTGSHPTRLECLNGLNKWRKGELDRQVECKIPLVHF